MFILNAARFSFAPTAILTKSAIRRRIVLSKRRHVRKQFSSITKWCLEAVGKYSRRQVWGSSACMDSICSYVNCYDSSTGVCYFEENCFYAWLLWLDGGRIRARRSFKRSGWLIYVRIPEWPQSFLWNPCFNTHLHKSRNTWTLNTDGLTPSIPSEFLGFRWHLGPWSEHFLLCSCLSILYWWWTGKVSPSSSS